MMPSRRRVSCGSWQAQGLGTRRASDGSRRSALRKSRRGPLLEPYELTVGQSRKLAADNALEVEWLAAREDLKRLIHRSMTAVEVGVRLQVILARFPSLASASGCTSFTPFNDGEAGQVSKELVPLLLLECTRIRDRDCPSLFPADGVLGPKSIKLGAEAWLYLAAAALNGLDSHGNCIAFSGPPTSAQAKALAELRTDCLRFCADSKARTPTDFDKEFGANAHG